MYREPSKKFQSQKFRRIVNRRDAKFFKYHAFKAQGFYLRQDLKSE
jgi:hypothetical protein